MTLMYYTHLPPFTYKKIGFWVKKGKIWNFSKFSIRLTSEALVTLICFLNCWLMFVSTEDIQTMILSTEWPLCHVGELRYGLTKFFGGNPKIPENAFLLFKPILMHLYSSKWYSEAPTHHIWKHISQWIILGYLVGNKSFLAKILKCIQDKRPETGKPWMAFGPICTQNWWRWEIHLCPWINKKYPLKDMTLT